MPDPKDSPPSIDDVATFRAPECPGADPRIERASVDPHVDQNVDRVVKIVLEQSEDGWTLRPGYAPPSAGTVVSLPFSAGFAIRLDLAKGGISADVLEAEIYAWLKKSLPYLAKHDDTYIGGWVAPDTRRLYFDVSERYDDHAEAIRLGQERNQESVFRFDDGKAYSTGGDGT